MQESAFEQPLAHISTDTLLQEVRRFELSIIEGTALPEDYDSYVNFQLVLAQRNLNLDTVLDPRD